MPERVGPARREMIGGVHSMRALASGGALALAGLLGLGVAPAQAATVGVSPDEPGRLVFTAVPGEVNAVAITTVAASHSVEFRDSAALSAGSGCTAQAEGSVT